jgi:hypothetical protein
MNDRMIFLRHEVPEASPGLLFFVGVMLCLSSLAVGSVMGFEVRDWLQRQHDAQKPLQARPVTKPVQLIPCTYEGRLEHDRICRARLRSMKVGGQ